MIVKAIFRSVERRPISVVSKTIPSLSKAPYVQSESWQERLNSLEYSSTEMHVPCQMNSLFINVLGIFERHLLLLCTGVDLRLTPRGNDNCIPGTSTVELGNEPRPLREHIVTSQKASETSQPAASYDLDKIHSKVCSLIQLNPCDFCPPDTNRKGVTH